MRRWLRRHQRVSERAVGLERVAQSLGAVPDQPDADADRAADAPAGGTGRR